MLTITDGGSLTRALGSPVYAGIKRLLTERCDQLGGDIRNQVKFVVTQQSDTLGDAERALGFLINSNDGHEPEWGEDHGSIIELCWIFTDDGFAHVLIVPKIEDIDPELLSLSRKYASETS